jgi:hypothetical protein
VKLNAFCRRKLAKKPSISRKRNRRCLRKRKSKYKRKIDRKRERADNDYSRRKPASEPPFIRKRNRHCIRKRKSKHKRERREKVSPTKRRIKQNREIDRKKRSSSEAVCIQSKKSRYEAVNQSEAKLTLPQEEKEQA